MAENRSHLTSHKGKKKRPYTMEFKKQVVSYAEEKSNRIWKKLKQCKWGGNVLKEEGENVMMKS